MRARPPSCLRRPWRRQVTAERGKSTRISRCPRRCHQHSGRWRGMRRSSPATVIPWACCAARWPDRRLVEVGQDALDLVLSSPDGLQAGARTLRPTAVAEGGRRQQLTSRLAISQQHLHCSTCPGRIGRMLHSVSDDSLSSPYAIALEALESNARMPLDEHVEELPRRSESLGSHGSPLSRGSAAALGRLAGGSGRSVSSSRACRVRSTVRPSTADQGLPLGAPQIVVSAGGGARSRLHRVTSLTGRDVELAAHAFRGSGEPRTPLREALATVAGGGHRDGYRCRRRALWCPPLRAVPPRRPPAAGLPVAAPGPGAGRGRPTRRCRWVGFSQQNASPAEQLGAQSRGGPYSQST